MSERRSWRKRVRLGGFHVAVKHARLVEETHSPTSDESEPAGTSNAGVASACEAPDVGAGLVSGFMVEIVLPGVPHRVVRACFVDGLFHDGSAKV